MRTPDDEVPPVEWTTGRLEIDAETGRFRDEHGREVMMRGINAGGRSKWAPFLPFPIPDAAELAEVERRAEVFFGRIPEWGLDTVRLPFSWEALEPQRGQYDRRYLERYRAMIEAAWSHRLRVVVDFHQDVYASPFAGDGFPIWTLPSHLQGRPRRDDPQWFLRYAADADVQYAYERFWHNADGIREAFGEMWETMAEEFGDHPAVAGFEIINEPGWGEATDIEAWKHEVLLPFYEEIEDRIHAVAPEVPVLYNPPGIEGLVPGGVDRVRPEGDKLVYAPHHYDGGLVRGEAWSGRPPEPVVETFAAFRDEHATPVFVGEFGITHGAEGGHEWLERFVDALDAHRISGTLWEYSVSDEAWNGEDLAVVTPEGDERPVLDVYVRPWLRAVAGTEAEFRWDAEAERVEASWLSDGGTTEVVVPSRLFDGEPDDLEVESVDGAYTWDDARQELRVRAPAGSYVDVRFST